MHNVVMFHVEHRKLCTPCGYVQCYSLCGGEKLWITMHNVVMFHVEHWKLSTPVHNPVHIYSDGGGELCITLWTLWVLWITLLIRK